MLENGKRYIIKDTGISGRLEAPPLYDRGNPPVSEDTGILWIPDFGDQSETWRYVVEEDLEEADEN